MCVSPHESYMLRIQANLVALFGDKGKLTDSINKFLINDALGGADPGFPVRGAWTSLWGRGPLTRALFSENERIGSYRGRAPKNFCM